MNSNYSEAKQIFQAYNGNHYFMAVDGILERYKAMGVPTAIERSWLLEGIACAKKDLYNLENGRAAMEAFEKIVTMGDELKEANIHYELLEFLENNAEQLDTISVLIMAERMMNSRFLSEKNGAAVKGKKRLYSVFLCKAKTSINADESYCENGVFPDYFSKQALEERLKKDMESIERELPVWTCLAKWKLLRR